MKDFIIRNINDNVYVLLDGLAYRFKLIEHFGKRLICYTEDHKIYFFYDNGEIHSYDYFEYLSTFNCLKVEKDQMWGAYSRTGIQIVPPDFHYLSFMNKFISCYHSDKGYLLYKYDGLKVFEDYAKHIFFDEGYFVVTFDDKEETYAYNEV